MAVSNIGPIDKVLDLMRSMCDKRGCYSHKENADDVVFQV